MTGAVCCALCVGYFYSLDHFLFWSAHFSPIFRYLLTTFDAKAAWLGLAVCIAAAVWNRNTAFLRLADFLGSHPSRVALGVSTLLAVGAVFVYHNYPLSMDEYAAVFQSKVFASGSLAAHLPRDLIDWFVVRGFNGSFLIASPETGKVIGAYWPGFALLLTPFQFFNLAWLCNAGLSGLAIWLIHWITKEITRERAAAGWAMLFAMASGAFVANGLSFYSMQAHLTANLLFVALLIRPSSGRAFGAGLAGSLALVLHNPIPHALFAVPWIASMAASSNRRHLLFLSAGYLPGIAIGILWLALRTDIATHRYGIAALNGMVYGAFGWPNSTLLNMRVAALVKMFVWAVPSLFVFAFLGIAKYREDARVHLMATSATLTFIGYFFVVFDQGHGWGYRYFHSAWGIIPILAGCAMVKELPAKRQLVPFAGATATLSLLLIIPLQLSQIQGFISDHLAQLQPAKTPGNNIYFIHPLGGFYAADMVQFDPLLRDRDLILVSHGPILDTELVQRNWPNAIEISSGRVADQWYLGSEDQRIPIPGGNGRRQFVIAQIPR